MWIGVLVQVLQGCSKSAHTEPLADICIRILYTQSMIFPILDSWPHIKTSA